MKSWDFNMTAETFISKNTEETEAIGFAFAKTLRPGDFVAMFGGLGAGKTAFVRGAAKFLAPNARVQSPTYTIVNEYPGSIPMYHFDMYRIDDSDSLYTTGYYDYLESGGICFAEWSENILPWLPKSYISVMIEKDETAPEKRRIIIQKNDGAVRKDSK